MNTPGGHFEDGRETPPPGDDVRAGEYVLGVLDAAERRQVEARLASDDAFARLVDAWEQALSPWLLRVASVAPSAHVWPRIRTRLGWPSVDRGEPGVWNSLPFWRVATAFAAAASVAAIVFALRPQAPPPAPAPIVVQTPPAVEEQAARPVAVLARDDGSTGWIASIDATGGKLTMVPVPSPDDAQGRVNELWIIPADGAPLSLGLVSNQKAHTVIVPAAIRDAIAVGSTLAVTLEPQAGMPHTAPSGPIVAKGGIEQI